MDDQKLPALPNRSIWFDGFASQILRLISFVRPKSADDSRPDSAGYRPPSAPPTTNSLLVVVCCLITSMAYCGTNHSLSGPWQLRSLDQFGVELRDFGYGPQGYIAIGNMGFVGHSKDGIHWTSRQLRPLEHYNRLLSTPGGYVRAGYYLEGNIQKGAIWHSDDSMRWTRVFSAEYPIEQMVQGPSGYILLLQARSESRVPRCYGSVDGVHWQSFEIPSLKNGDTVLALRGDSATYSMLLQNGVLLRSPDGKSWTAWAYPGQDSKRWKTFTTSGRRWIGVDSEDVFHVSEDDGLTWTTNSIATGKDLTAIAENGGTVLAVSKSGNIFLRDSSGIWSNQNPPAPGSGFDRICFVHDRWIASGNDGALLTSTTGLDWKIISEDFVFFRGVAATESNIVAIAQNHTMSSPDGTNWTYSTSPNFRSIAAGLGRFVATADAIYSSEDGIRWTLRQNLPTQSTETLVVFSTDTFLVVEGSEGIGRIYKSSNGIDWETMSTNVGPPVSVVIDVNPGGFNRYFWAGNEVWGWWHIAPQAQGRHDFDWGNFGATGEFGAKTIAYDGTCLNLTYANSPNPPYDIVVEPNIEPFLPKVIPYGMSYADEHFFLFGASRTNYSPRFYCAYKAIPDALEECSPYLSRGFHQAASNSKAVVVVGQGILQAQAGGPLAYQPALELVPAPFGFSLEWQGSFLTLHQIYFSENLKDWRLLKESELSDEDYGNFFPDDRWISVPMRNGDRTRYFKVKVTTYRDWVRDGLE